MIEAGFKIRLEARLKNGALVNAREQLGLSQVEVAEGVGISRNYYGACENMRFYPSKKMQKKICEFYSANNISLQESEVFPEELREYEHPGKMSAEREIPKERLVSLSTAIDQQELPYVEPRGEEIAEQNELGETIGGILDMLPYRQKEVITMRYGLGGTPILTLKEIGKKFNIGRERVRLIEREALRRLQHPVRSHRLKTFLED